MTDQSDQYLKIPVILFKLKIGAIERYVIALMISFGGETYASNEYMAEMFGCSRQAIIDAVNKLVERKYVTRKRTKNGRVITLTSQETLLLKASEVVKKLGASSQETLPNSKVYKSTIGNNRKVARTRKKFVKPTAKEVSEYAESIGYQLDGHSFIDKYDGCGWVTGRGAPMADWKAVVRTWKRNEGKYGHSRSKPKSKGFAEQKSNRTDFEIDV